MGGRQNSTAVKTGPFKLVWPKTCSTISCPKSNKTKGILPGENELKNNSFGT
jgi:hypothetical protein